MARRLDDLQNGYRIYQDPASFCFGIDAVLLAHYASVKAGERVLDLGCGSGVVPLIMAASAPSDVRFTGLEIQSGSAELARESVRLNELEERIEIIEGDLREIGRQTDEPRPEREIQAKAYQVVTCNPPYYAVGSGRTNEASAKALARHEILCTLKDVVRAAEYALCDGGRFDLIHIPERLPEIFEELKKAGLEPKAMRLVHPSQGKPPTMVLIEAVKGGRPGLKAAPPLFIYEDDGQYTDEILKIYGS